jgi:hypothetical protein
MSERQTTRKIEYAEEIKRLALEAVFASDNAETFRVLQKQQVEGHRKWKVIGEARQEAVREYTRGVLDALARLHGGNPSVQFAPSMRCPDEIQALQPDVKWHKHANGGGWISATAEVPRSTWVGPYAIVYGYTKLGPNQRVAGHTRLCVGLDAPRPRVPAQQPVRPAAVAARPRANVARPAPAPAQHAPVERGAHETPDLSWAAGGAR